MSMLSYWSNEMSENVFQNKPVPLNENLHKGALRLKKEVDRSWTSQDGVY